ncbi:hypothetical protein DPMN_018285 [Dreissena polymorpha]|uniref:Uncharacterized protein n=1 Tax=Dreissena polymorpha TaxID=45954 RepID=A0A9D4NCX6_DREPO|nr:hypothetical protein DPMN_018285 [Dreissena polymorpha]
MSPYYIKELIDTNESALTKMNTLLADRRRQLFVRIHPLHARRNSENVQRQCPHRRSRQNDGHPPMKGALVVADCLVTIEWHLHMDVSVKNGDDELTANFEDFFYPALNKESLPTGASAPSQTTTSRRMTMSSLVNGVQLSTSPNFNPQRKTFPLWGLEKKIINS